MESTGGIVPETPLSAKLIHSNACNLPSSVGRAVDHATLPISLGIVLSSQLENLVRPALSSDPALWEVFH